MILIQSSWIGPQQINTLLCLTSNQYPGSCHLCIRSECELSILRRQLGSGSVAVPQVTGCSGVTLSREGADPLSPCWVEIPQHFHGDLSPPAPLRGSWKQRKWLCLRRRRAVEEGFREVTPSSMRDGDLRASVSAFNGGWEQTGFLSGFCAWSRFCVPSVAGKVLGVFSWGLLGLWAPGAVLEELKLS